MVNVDANFHTLVAGDNPITRVRIYFIGDGVDCTDDNDVTTNGTLLCWGVGDTDSNRRIGQDGIKFTEYYNPEYNVTIGRAVSSQVEMTLLNTDGALDNFTYGRCKIYLDVYDSANSTWLSCPMGVYIIDLPTRRKSQLIHAFGYDQMQKLDGICDTWWAGLNFSGGLTLLQIVNSMASQIGVSVSTATASAIVNSSVTYTAAPFDCVETTYREVLKLIAEATGTVARFDRDGALDLKWFKAAQIGGNTVEIDTDIIGNQCLSIDLAEYQVAAIDLLKVKIAEDDVGVTVGSGTNQYTILDNLFLDGTVATITTRATAIYNRLNALGAYKPIQSKLIWDWSIEAGDIIEITRDSTTYATPIFQQTMTWRGGYVVSELVNGGDNVRPVPNYDERSTYRMQSEMSAKVGDNEIISKINQSAEQITIQANKINLVGTVTANNGFVVNQDGTVEMNGATVNGTITVGGANNADGILYIKDANGNTSGRIDRNGIEVYQSEYGRINSLAFSGGYMIMTTGGTAAAFLNRSISGGGWFGVYDSQGRVRAIMNGDTANLYAVDENGLVRAEIASDGTLALTDANQIRRFYMGLNGLFDVKDTSGNIRYQLDSADGSIVSKDASEVKRSELNNSGLTVYDSNGTVIGSLLESSGKSDLTVDDATVNGVLDVVPRRCYATLSQEGWYRILRFDATNSFDVLGADGAIIDFYIIRQYNNLDNDVHKITLLRTYNKNVFVGEESLTNTFGISRIRLTLHDGGDDDRQAFVDIYNETSSENPVSVYFNVYTHRSYADKWNAVNFTSVGPSPYGETVVTEYEFVANTDSMIAFTPTAGSNYAGYGNCWYSRNGRTVHLHVGLSGLTANTPQNVFTMPEGFRPITIAAANGAGGSTYTAISRIAVSTTGTVQIISDDQYACVDITYLADV